MPEFITREAFRAWLDSMPDDAKPCDENHCPLEAQARRIKVGSKTWRYNGEYHSRLLPDWAVYFVRRIDRSYSHSSLTVADIRRVLDEVPA